MISGRHLLSQYLLLHVGRQGLRLSIWTVAHQVCSLEFVEGHVFYGFHIYLLIFNHLANILWLFYGPRFVRNFGAH